MTINLTVDSTTFSFSDSLTSLGCQDIQVIWDQQAILSDFVTQISLRITMMFYLAFFLIMYYRMTVERPSEGWKRILQEFAELAVMLWCMICLGAINPLNYYIIIGIVLVYHFVMWKRKN